MDSRPKQLRPRTIMRDTEVGQPAGWQGLDPMQQRTVDPVRTFETPLIYFPADIVIPANFNGSVPLPQRCCQIAFINLTANVWASFNSGGGRTMKDGFVMNGEFKTLDVATDALGGCLIQLGCY